MRLAALAVSSTLTLAACPKDPPPPVEPTATTADAPEPEQEPAPAPIPEGPLRYRGTLEFPGAGAVEFFVELRQDQGTWGGSLSIPTQMIMDGTLDDVVVTGEQLAFSLSAMKVRWTATLDPEGKPADCRFAQGAMSLSCKLEPTDAETLAEARNPTRSQTPKPPFSYEVADVEYDNTTDGVHLAGTLTVPSGPGPHPAALLISGSGAQDRDGSLLGHKPFWVLADQLTQKGIAVLRVDDRGVGGSTGTLQDATQEALARDVAAGVAFLRAHAHVDPAKVGVIGHSEGGAIGPNAASKDPEIAFVVMMGGLGVPGHEILREQSVAILRARGAPAAGIELARHQQAKVLRIALDNTPEQARPKLVEILGDNPQVDMMLTPWFQSFVHYDPVPALEALRCPVLVLSGELDLQVLPDQNIPAIEKALAGNRKRTTVHRFPGLNHLFQHATTGSPDEYATIDETLAPEVTAIIGEWIVEQTSGAKGKGRKGKSAKGKSAKGKK